MESKSRSSSERATPTKRIAIVGGGISGISCLWRLRDHEEYDVHVFEAESRLGGQANSVSFENDGVTAQVDTGFIVMNEESYPEFRRFLAALNVQTIVTDMSFGISVDDGRFEWGSHSLWSFFGVLSNVFRPWFWRLCFDILRFNYTSIDLMSEIRHPRELSTPGIYHHVLSEEQLKRGWEHGRLESIGDYLDRKNYSEQFKHYFLFPMAAAPWCIDPEEFARNFPAAFLIEFMADHRLLDTVTHTLRWQAFPKGSRAYINAFLATLKHNHHIHFETPIRTVRRRADKKVDLDIHDGTTETFDHVVLAVHAPQALQILGDEATSVEQELLSAFRTSRNVCVVHSDTSLLPVRPNAQTSWNCMMRTDTHSCGYPNKIPTKNTHTAVTKNRSLHQNGDICDPTRSAKISITFDMSRIQGIPPPGTAGSPGRVLVSLNPERMPDAPRSSHVYHHPLFSSDSVQASQRLQLINGVSGISFAGAWMGYGFHEDGFIAGTMAARHVLLKDGHPLPTPKRARRRWHRSSAPKTVIQLIQGAIDAVTWMQHWWPR